MHVLVCVWDILDGYDGYPDQPRPPLSQVTKAAAMPRFADYHRTVIGYHGTRLWTRSGVYRHAHIQLCVRNPDCILGTWLVQPIED
jgi:hypothetical protein